MRRSIRFGRVFGVDLALDTGWIFIFAMIVWSLSSRFHVWHPGWTSTTVLAVAAVTGLSFFASVLFHELAHALVAKAYGLEVRDITLHLFGGVANIEREPKTPGAELAIAVVGPIASLALGASMVALFTVLSGMTLTDATGDGVAPAMARLGPAMTLLVWLGPVNIALGLFNLIPAFPMDGGRILRAVLWKTTGDLSRATRWSTSVGLAIGLGFIGMGGMMALGAHVPFFGTGIGSGLWLAFIGLYLRGAAASYRVHAELAGAFDGVNVAAVMRAGSGGVPADTSLDSLMREWLLVSDEGVVPVYAGGRFAGVVLVEDVDGVPREAWTQRTAEQLMRPRESLPRVAPSDPVADVLGKLGSSGLPALPVVDEGALVGMLFARDIARRIARDTAQPSNGGSVPRPFTP